MTAYAIFFRERMNNPEEYAQYQQKMRASRETMPIDPLVLNGACETLEGDDIESVVVLTFPDMETARAWYFSPEYQAMRQHRLRSGEYRGVLVEGIPNR